MVGNPGEEGWPTEAEQVAGRLGGLFQTGRRRREQVGPIAEHAQRHQSAGGVVDQCADIVGEDLGGQAVAVSLRQRFEDRPPDRRRSVDGESSRDRLGRAEPSGPRPPGRAPARCETPPAAATARLAEDSVDGDGDVHRRCIDQGLAPLGRSQRVQSGPWLRVLRARHASGGRRPRT